jgi:hypothetical protein
LPSIEQVMPWLHQIFDAWEEHRHMREREAAELEAVELEALAALNDVEAEDADDDDDRREKKKKKKHKDKK